jgi:hypothetical protein
LHPSPCQCRYCVESSIEERMLVSESCLVKAQDGVLQNMQQLGGSGAHSVGSGLFAQQEG